MWVLGDLVELVRQDGDGRLHLVRPRHPRWLAFDCDAPGPFGWGRLLVVRPVAQLDEDPDGDGNEGVQGFTWGAAEGEEWQVQTDRVPRARTFGPLHSVVYRAKKGRTLADWDHAFVKRPTLRTGADGQLEVRGRVKVTERGIVS